MMSIGVMSAARTNSLLHASVDAVFPTGKETELTYPFSPLRMAFATSFTPRLT